MRKLLLLIAGGFIAGSSFAQSNNTSVVFVPNTADANTIQKHKVDVPFEAVSKHANNRAANKTTGNRDGWFSYLDLMYQSGTSQGWYYTIYQDSNLTGTDGQGQTYYVGTYGMGVSFDPTDSVYRGGDINGQTSAGYIQDFQSLPSFYVTASDAYTVDSVDFLGKYIRKNNYTDTLIVEVVKTSSSATGVYALQFNSSTNGINITPDGNPRFVTAIYDPATNRLSDSISSANIVRMTRVLDAAYFADSNTNGYHNTSFALPTALNVDPGERVMVYVTFRSGNAYPKGTNVDAANTFRLYSYELAGSDTWVRQCVGSYTSGLNATKQNKYVPPYNDFTYQGHNCVIPSVAYDNNAGNDVPYFQVHVKCPNCWGLNVADASKVISSFNAYPNPANTEVNVPFAVSAATDVNVTLTNAVGQAVATQSFSNVTTGQATFATSQLANGIYFIRIDANGQSATGRVVVAH